MSDKGSKEEKIVVMPNYQPNEKWNDFNFKDVNDIDDDDDLNLDEEDSEKVGYIGDDEPENEDVVDEPELEEEVEADSDAEVEVETEVKPGKKVDKKTAALIEQKRLNKELREKLAAAEAKTADETQAKLDAITDAKAIEELVEKGYGEDMAADIVAGRRKQATNDAVIAKLQFSNTLLRLEKSCPGISDHSDEIFALVKKTGLSAQQVWKAQFSQDSEFDIVTRAKAETTHRLKSGQGQRSGIVGQKSNTSQVKLSSEDERAYRILLKSGSKMSRADFKKNSGF